ncbi:calcium-binding protein [Paenibacillus sp. FSL R5-0912]|uniref:calcium-binding protein n=1 Tax=Paenibacillus sp. FSL R5-0912 TaxID=1536771 RepID=UPI0030ECCDE3
MLQGGAGDDVLDGGAGNDTLYGGDSSDTYYTRANGNDTYLFGRGSGQDTIIDYDGTAGNADVIRFAADVKPGDVTVRRNGSSLELLINGTSDKLTVASFFDASGRYVVESAVFADGTVWDEAALRTAALNVDGSEVGETLSGYDTNDTLRGYGGDDRLNGGAGDDVLDGGAGNDTLYGGDPYDTSYTRANGNDTYLFGRGYGQDTIVDYDGTAGNTDVIQFAADVNPGDITVRRSGSSLELLINGTNDKLTVANYFETSGKYVVELVQFADGTVWNEAAVRAAARNVKGSEASESLTGYEDNDILLGYGGDDRAAATGTMCWTEATATIPCMATPAMTGCRAVKERTCCRAEPGMTCWTEAQAMIRCMAATAAIRTIHAPMETTRICSVGTPVRIRSLTMTARQAMPTSFGSRPT